MQKTPSKYLKPLKENEIKVLLAILKRSQQGHKVYAHDIVYLAKVPVGTIYKVCYQLEHLSLIEAAKPKGCGTRGGSAKRHYTLTKGGEIYAETWKEAAAKFAEAMKEAYPKPKPTLFGGATGTTVTWATDASTTNGYTYGWFVK